MSSDFWVGTSSCPFNFGYPGGPNGRSIAACIALLDLRFPRPEREGFANRATWELELTAVRIWRYFETSRVRGTD